MTLKSEEVKDESKEDIEIEEASAETVVEESKAADSPSPRPEEEVQEEEEEEEEEESNPPKYIPRLIDASGNVTPRSRDQQLEPSDWTVKNVNSFLEVNECSNLVHNFDEKVRF